MKIWIREFFVGAFGGVLGGLTVSYFYLHIHINWTAITCLITVGALIVTTFENRTRFKQDWKNKIRTSNADELMKIISEYVGNYHNCQKMTIDILYSEHYDKIQNRNEVISNLESVTSQIRMLNLRISKEDSVMALMNDLINKIREINDEINDFYDSNNDKGKDKDTIKKNGEDENKRVNKNIEEIEKKSSEIYKELVSVNY